MLESLKAAMRLPDLRNRLLFVFAMMGVFVMGTWIPVPNVDHAALQRIFENAPIFGILDIFSGGALKRFSIMAMGIMPYISASIMFQLVAFAFPQMKELQREGEYGRQKIARYTRYATVALTLIQGTLVVNGFAAMGALHNATIIQKAQIVLAMSAGTCFLMWIGELITERGIGNGVSFLIFAGIVTRLPMQISQTIQMWLIDKTIHTVNVLLLVLSFLLTVVAIVWVTQGERRIPVRYADRVAGRRVIRGGRTHLPLRVAQAGVMPLIFAISVVLFPAQIAQMMNNSFAGKMPAWNFFGMQIQIGWLLSWVSEVFNPGQHWIGAAVYGLMVMVFTYFYTAVIFDPRDLADNLRKHGGQIQGFSPGLPTAQFINKVLSRITFAGGVFLAFVALASWYVPVWTGVHTFQLVGGTSLLIVVSVALETMQQIEQQLRLRQYEGVIR